MEKTITRIVIIGAGSIAAHFGKALLKNGYIINQIVSRTPEHAKNLATQLDTSYTSDLKNIDSDADVYLLAVSDDAIADLSKSIKINKGIIIHTSGFINMKVLADASNDYGVVYPLQSLSQDHNIDFYNNVPLCIEASNNKTLKIIRKMANDLSANVYEIDSIHRKTLHIAAVFMNNFSNHLFNISEKLCSQNDLDFKLLEPLAKETIKKAFVKKSPAHVQTGPAARKDLKVIEDHLKWLEKNASEYKTLYKILTDSILKK